MESKAMKKAMRGGLGLLMILPTTIPLHASARDEKSESSGVGQSQIEQDIEKFWDKRRKVAVIQKRLFDEKTGRWEISAHFGVIPNDPFVNYLPVGLRFTYHFREWIGLEFGGLYMPSFTSSLADGISGVGDRKSTRLNSSHLGISYAVFCLKKITNYTNTI